jgi:NAD(P)-dependent dehydrogenase (short-subunit alcohol dehydrogenase family)
VAQNIKDKVIVITGAVRALSEGLRQEVKPYNIRSTIISPGAARLTIWTSRRFEMTAKPTARRHRFGPLRLATRSMFAPMTVLNLAGIRRL